MKIHGTESANGLLLGRNNRDFVSNLNGLGFAPIITTGHDVGEPIPEGLTEEERREAWREWDKALEAERNHWKNASEYEKMKYPELYASMCRQYGL